jgi:mannose-1-phosphate guanylyltransferase
MERGCLWNSFVMIGHVNAYLKLIRNAVPGLVKLFESVRPSLFTASETAAVSDLYSIIRATSFSQDVLSARPIDLAVLRGIGLGWSDLGVPCRVLSLLESKGVQTEWGSKQGGWRADAAVATG